MTEKFCPWCKISKPLEEFGKLSRTHDGKHNWCRRCNSERTKRWHAAHPGLRAEWAKRRQRQDPRYALLNGAKRRAKNAHLAFDLTLNDICLPSVCPILGITLLVADKHMASGSYSLDRIDPSEGYIRGNVWVISHLANTMKQNASPDLLLKFGQWAVDTFSGGKDFATVPTMYRMTQAEIDASMASAHYKIFTVQ